MNQDVGRFHEMIKRLTQNVYVYTRPDLLGLEMFLKTSAQSPMKYAPKPHQEEGSDTTSFVVRHELQAGLNARSGSSPASLANSLSKGVGPVPEILFLRGYATPELLARLASEYGISPDLYGRHLEYLTSALASRNYYSSPALPSSTARVFQLKIPTIYVSDDGSLPYVLEDLRSARKSELGIMNSYSLQLRSMAKVGDSIVRKCYLFSKQQRVLEQTVTAEVSLVRGSWRAVVWLDNGLDLSQSMKGVQKPWDPPDDQRSWQSYFLPVIVHPTAGAHTPMPYSPETASIGPASRPGTPQSPNRGNTNTPTAERKATQNICLLPSQYGSRLDRDLASEDALYALSELFQFAASANRQFLNFVRHSIEREVSFIDVERRPASQEILLANLRYIRAILKPYEQSLSETSTLLQNRSSLDWPRNEESEKTANMLLTDFKCLLEQAKSLTRECEQGMATLANAAALEESRRTADMGMRVERLTMIATVFIPLSFVCSVWGMNFTEIGSGSQHIWWFFVTAVPIVLFSFLIYRYDLVIGTVLEAWKAVRRAREKRWRV